ncbi:hypothetical protein [Marivita sp.]|uniref:hypothetical protein n=1 Tax=Marivita sp. TaxID=2003365 RepID=UPI003F712546
MDCRMRGRGKLVLLDFGATRTVSPDLVAQSRAILAPSLNNDLPGMALGRDRSIRQIPPTEVLYLQRKAAGLFLLATRLRAHVPLRDLFLRYV